MLTSLARAAKALGTYYNTGEGGLHEDFYQYGPHTIVQGTPAASAYIRITSRQAPPSKLRWAKVPSRESADTFPA